MSATPPTIRERILEAAFSAFMRLGYGGTSTAEIARLARVSKRDLYANFSSKQAMLAACVTERAGRMQRPLDLPAPTDRDTLYRTLVEFGAAIVREVSRPEVLATYRLAIMEAENAPDVARTLDRHGREANAGGTGRAADHSARAGSSDPGRAGGSRGIVSVAGHGRRTAGPAADAAWHRRPTKRRRVSGPNWRPPCLFGLYGGLTTQRGHRIGG